MTNTQMTGSLSVLNVGAGDIELKFNPHQPDELERALKMLKDMEQRGYAILVREADGSYVRAKGVDAERGVYIISGEPQLSLEAKGRLPVTLDAQYDVDAPPEPPALPEAPPKKRRGRPPNRTAPIATSQATAIGRSAGG